MIKALLKSAWHAAAARFPALYWLRRGRDYYAGRVESPCEQAMRREVLDLISSSAPARVLEYGVGNASFLKKLHERLPGTECHGVDISATQLATARATFPEGRYAVSDLSKLDFPDAHFNVVYGIGVLIYLPPDERARALTELRRVTRDRLVAVEYLTGDFDESLRRRFASARDFRYDYDIPSALRDAGFSSVESGKIAAAWNPKVNTLGELPHGRIVARP